MASRGEELNTRITATDDASKVIDKVAEKVEDLEDQPHEVELDADASKADQEIRALDRRFDDLTKEQRVAVLEVEAKKAKRELDQITRQLAAADGEDVTIFVDARDAASAKLQAISSELRDLQAEAGETGDAISDELGGSFDGLGSKFSGIGAQLGGKLVAGFAATGALMVAALQKSWDKAGGIRQITGEFRLSADEAAKYGKIAGELYAENWGDALPEVQRVVATAGQRLEDTTGETLGAISAQIFAASQTWGIEYESVIRSITQLTQNGLAPTSQAALDLIVTGFQDGADEAGDFLDTIDEYSQHWAAMGLSGEEALNQIVAGLQLGQRDTDKLADAVKEMRLRVTEDAEATTDAYEALGLEADETRKKFLAGGDSAREAFLEVIGALRDVKDPIKQNALAIALIGTQYEDLGPTALEALGTIQGAIRDTTDAAQNLADTVGQVSPWDRLERRANRALGAVGDRFARLVQLEFGGGGQLARDLAAQAEAAASEIEGTGYQSSRAAGIIDREIGRAKVAFDLLGGAAEDAGDDIGGIGEDARSAAETIARDIELARVNVERFGSDGVEQMGAFKDATEDALSPFTELQEKLDAEKTFDRLAEAIEKVKAAPGDREETRDLLGLVLDLGRAYEDIPPEVITRIYTQVDRGQIEAAFNEIQGLANQRDIRINVSTGGTSFRIDPNGGAPTQIKTPTTYTAGPSVTNIYQIAPTPSTVVGATNSDLFVNGSRTGPR